MYEDEPRPPTSKIFYADRSHVRVADDRKQQAPYLWRFSFRVLDLLYLVVDQRSDSS
jgi:hypothetical protein